MNVGLFVGFLLSLFCFPSECFEVQEPQKPDREVKCKFKVTMVVILANDRCTVVDPRLKAVAEEVRLHNPKLTGFTWVSVTQVCVPASEQVKFPCMEDCSVDLTVCKCPDEPNKACVKAVLPHKEEIKFNVVVGKFLPFMTGYQTKEYIPPARAAKALVHLLSGQPLSTLRATEIFENCRCRPRVMVAICVEPCTPK